MAKTDSFFIRASVDTSGAWAQTSIDLGAYVDALGKSVLRIHNIQVQYMNTGGAVDVIACTNASGASGLMRWQLTTQSQGAIVNTTNKSLISAGSLQIGADAAVRNVYETLDVNVQDWTNGYLVGVEQIYLGGLQGSGLDAATVSIVLECTVETLSQSAAMALALSQQ